MATVIDAIIRLQDQMTDKLKSVNDSLKKTERMSKATSKSIANMGKKFDKAAATLQPFAMAAVGAAGVAVKSFAEFDTKHHALLNKLEGETKRSAEVQKQAFYDMSLDVAKSANELVDIATEVGGAIPDLTGKQINEITKLTAKFAIATDTDSKIAVQATTNIVNAYKIPADQIPQMLDKVTAASNYSAANVDTLNESFIKCASSAALMNQTVDSSSAALAVLSNNGINGAIAGTAMNNVYQSLADPKAVEGLKNIGVEVYDAQGKVRELADITADYDEKTKHMSGAQRLALTNQLFGDIGGRAWNTLTNNSKDYKDMLDKISKSQGAVDEAYAEMNKSLGVSLQMAKNSAMVILLKIGEKLAPQIKVISDYIVDLSKKISRADDGTIDWIIGIGKLIVGFYGLFKVIGTGMSIFSTITAHMKTIKLVFNVVKIAGSGLFKALIIGIRAVGMAFMSNPIGLVIGAIVIALALLWYNWDTVKEYLIKGWDLIKAAFNSAVSWFTDTVVPGFTGAMQAIGDFFGNIWEGIKSGVAGACDFIRSTINTIIGLINGLSFTIPDWVPGFGGSTFSMNIPLLFTGTEDWKGGLAKIHDQGGEIVDLPSGTRVIPHDRSIREARDMGRLEGAAVTRNNNSTTINVNKLADEIVVREEADIDKFTSMLAEKLNIAAINRIEGAV